MPDENLPIQPDDNDEPFSDDALSSEDDFAFRPETERTLEDVNSFDAENVEDDEDDEEEISPEAERAAFLASQERVRQLIAELKARDAERPLKPKPQEAQEAEQALEEYLHFTGRDEDVLQSAEATNHKADEEENPPEDSPEALREIVAAMRLAGATTQPLFSPPSDQKTEDDAPQFIEDEANYFEADYFEDAENQFDESDNLAYLEDDLGDLDDLDYDPDYFEAEDDAIPPKAEAEAEALPKSEPRRPSAPQPEEQSGFVNPALARVAAFNQRREAREPSELWLGLRTILIMSLAAFVTAFIFNYWTPDSFLSDEFVANLQVVRSTQGLPTAIPSPLPTFEVVQRVGIITGHSGPPLDPRFEVDPGAVCDDNNDGVPELTELEINQAVSSRVAALLAEYGYAVEMLEEFDPRLDNYRAAALVSIHTNTCQRFFEGGATGFNMQASERSPMRDRDNLLVDCLVLHYGQASGLARHFGSPPDLVDYHVFRKISVDTPTVIVELGFMYEDRAVLTGQQDALARGIVNGIDCFLNPSPANQAPPASDF